MYIFYDRASYGEVLERSYSKAAFYAAPDPRVCLITVQSYTWNIGVLQKNNITQVNGEKEKKNIPRTHTYPLHLPI